MIRYRLFHRQYHKHRGVRAEPEFKRAVNERMVETHRFCARWYCFSNDLFDLHGEVPEDFTEDLPEEFTAVNLPFVLT